MAALKRFCDRSSRGLFWIGAIAMALMAIHVSLDILLKYLLNKPIAGTIEIVSAYYMVAVIFLPLPLVQRDRRHIVVELFTQSLGPRWRAVLDVMGFVLALVYMGLLTWYGAKEAWRSTAVGESLDIVFFELSTWPSRWFVPFGCGFMGLWLVFQTVQAIGGAIKTPVSRYSH